MQPPLALATALLVVIAFASGASQAAPQDSDLSGDRCATKMPRRTDPAYRAAVEKGLEWLAQVQQRDGHWQGTGAHDPPVAITALAGLAMLMEGSTLEEGRYAPHLHKAVMWLRERTQPNGLIGDPRQPSEASRYMFGQGYGLLFLSLAYASSEDADQRKDLEEVLKRAVDFTGKAQTTRGGWGYVSATDGGDFAENCVTTIQVQSLRAAQNAGVAVPKDIMDKVTKYLMAPTPSGCTFPDGQLGYMPGRRATTPGITAAGIACLLGSGEGKNPAIKQWLTYARKNVRPFTANGRLGQDEYTQYYWAQVLCRLGEDGYGRIFPESRTEERLTWSQYRKTAFSRLLQTQNAAGCWEGTFGQVYTTAAFLAILQLEKGSLPFYQRTGRSSPMQQ
jgi:hypothetical protein